MTPAKIRFLQYLCELDPIDERVSVEVEQRHLAHDDFMAYLSINITLSGEMMDKLISTGKIKKLGDDGKSAHYGLVEE